MAWIMIMEAAEQMKYGAGYYLGAGNGCWAEAQFGAVELRFYEMSIFTFS